METLSVLMATQGGYSQTTFVAGERGWGGGRNERQDVTPGGRFTMTVQDSHLVLFINTRL